MITQKLIPSARPLSCGSRFLLQLALMVSVLAVLITLQADANAAHDYRTRFKPVPTQYIAALADPNASSGDNAQTWGLWTLDPGPRGVKLDNYDQLLASGGVAPANWKFEDSGWWLEENGLIMEAPEFPLPPGDYLVTGGRKVLTVLTVHPVDENGNSRWELEHGASVYDVTHLGCRSALYTPMSDGDASCSPEQAPRDAFRVSPGAPMPPVPGCNKQDYAVLIVVGVPIDE
jgi:hypothetical protein